MYHHMEMTSVQWKMIHQRQKMIFDHKDITKTIGEMMALSFMYEHRLWFDRAVCK